MAIPKPIGTDQLTAIKAICKELGRNPEDFVWQASQMRTTSITKLTWREAWNLIKWLNENKPTTKH